MIMPADDLRQPSGWRRLALRLGLILLAAYLLHLLLDWAMAQAQATGNMPLMLGFLTLLLVVYAVLLAIPYVPGIEIGIGLLAFQGAEVAPFVYLGTVLGLSAAFLAGRFLPYAWLHSVFFDLRLTSACRLLERIAPLDLEARLALLGGQLPSWLRPLLGHGRYLVLACLLNMPGNALLGGGGGLAFIAGLSRLYGTAATLAVMALAVLPVPLWVWLYGAGFLER